MADSFQLKAIITAVDQLSGPLKGMGKSLKGFQKEASGIMMNAAAMGAAITSAFVIPINQAMQFESTMADVRKVVDFDTPQQFKQMSEDILKLSTQLPMTADGIGQIVAAGGQAGIARNELKQFATDAVKMGVAFDQTAEESGQMMAQWRTAFKMTQSDVVGLADKINYLGNTGPANAAKISDVVTRIGPLGEIAGVASGEIAAMGATIAGMGVESEVTATGLKNFMKALTSGASATKSQKMMLKSLKINPKKLAYQMQKDAKGAMINVLESLSKLPKAEQSAAMNSLFGSESAGAIAPLLTNLDLLRANFKKVSEAQQYAGSMQKEYESRAATTANSVQLLKNQFSAASISIGDMFLPDIVKITQKIQPMIERFRQLTKANPEMIRSTFKFGATLLGIGAAMGVVGKAFKTFDSIMKMSTMGKVVSLLVIAGGLIVSNWDQIGPVVKSVWKDIDGIAEALGGWENVLRGVAAFTAGAWLVSMSKGLGGANKEAGKLSGNLRDIAKMGLISVTIGVAIDMFNRIGKLHEEAGKQNISTGQLMVNKMNQKEADRGYQGFIPRLKELLGMDQPGDKAVGLVQSQKPQQGELKVSFENAPPGMRVAPAGNTLPWYQYDVGYNRFSPQK
ncbi:phage tail tape measure protein [Erwinia sp. AnSW2-5]|uniref:phage tail tape measure protein n=1 Tax=Erwinia sp. AnSW2-5 TaxID=3367692 RepID=UPI00385C74C5